MEKNSIVAAKHKIVVIGGSAGSLGVIMRILPSLHAGLRVPLIIVTHRRSGEDSLLTQILSSKTTLKVKEAEEKEKVLPGIIYLAPANYHLLIEDNFTFSLDASEKINFSRPSIDVTFECAAALYRNNTACILLSGANADGVEGLKMVKKYNGIAAIQDPATAEVSFMPQQALQNVAVDHIFEIEEIGHFINEFGAGSF